MQISAFDPSQRLGLIELLVEMGRYYDAPGPPTPEDIATHLDDVLTRTDSPVTLVTARASMGGVIGLAALVLLPSILEAVGTGRLQCQLKELYVSNAHRGVGVGEALLRWSARFAIENGCGRMDWNVRSGNARGIRFYERHGGSLVEDRLSYRLTGAALSELANSST